MTSVIWRVVGTDADETAAAANEKIEFNITPVFNDVNGYVHESEQEYDVGFADNPKAAGALNEIQDTGLAAIVHDVIGTIPRPQTHAAMNTFKKWMIEAKTTTDFPKGRFGLILDDSPSLNLKPTATLGYIPINLKHKRPQEQTARMDFIIKLRVNGDPGNSPYNWNP